MAPDASPTRMFAAVIRVDVVGNKATLVLNRGLAHGLDKSWSACFVDVDGACTHEITMIRYERHESVGLVPPTLQHQNLSQPVLLTAPQQN